MAKKDQPAGDGPRKRRRSPAGTARKKSAAKPAAKAGRAQKRMPRAGARKTDKKAAAKTGRTLKKAARAGTRKTEKKAAAKTRGAPKRAAKEQKEKPKKLTKAEQKRLEKEAEEARKAAERTLEEELEEQLTEEEIENFQIEKVDMEKLINKVSEIIATFELGGMLQNDLWKKLKLSNRDGSRLALKLERMGIITREKILEKGRWTYRLIIKKTPISTQSIENAPCLVCPVEQKCSLDGEISPRSCQFIEDWVIAEMKGPKKPK